MQQFFIHQQVNFITFFVLLLMFAYSKNILDRKVPINKIYLEIMGLNILIIVLDVARYFTTQTPIPSIINYILDYIILIILPMLAYLYLKFMSAYFSKPYKMEKTVGLFFALMLISNAVAAIFLIKINGLYKIILPFSISIIFVVYSGCIIIKNKKTLIKFEYIYIMSVNILTTAALIFQLCVSETKFIPICNGFILILMFIVLQQRELYRDSLTGLRNRHMYKKCLDTYSKNADCEVSIVVIDLDYFKNINDTYGHAEGDYALKVFAKLLQRVYSSKGIVIRTGGDEFIIILNKVPLTEVDELNKKLTKIVDKFNNKSNKPYRIKYSYGSGIYNNHDITLEQFIHEMDMLMYKNKSERKSIKNRNTKSNSSNI